MLKQRILTALVLLPLVLGMLFFASKDLWALFSGLIVLLTLWEYSRMSGMSEQERTPYLVGTGLFMLLAFLGNWRLPRISVLGGIAVLVCGGACVVEAKMAFTGGAEALLLS